MRSQLQSIARQLFSDNAIDVLIGYEEGSLPFTSRPLVITGSKNHSPSDDAINKLTWNSFCSNNLAVFLPDYFAYHPSLRTPPPKPRIGIVTKGCDARSIFTLIKEKQAPREHLVLIGVPCQGMVDIRQLETRLAGQRVQKVDERDGRLYIRTTQEELALDREEFLQAACRECRFPMPEGTNYLLEGAARTPCQQGDAIVKAFEQRPPGERWEYFQQEMSKCIRCYACRQACPTCWCKECFAEQTDLQWIGAAPQLSDVMIFHLTRIFHQAGRCVECDACYRACPMEIDLRTFTKKIGHDVEALFDYVPDFDEETIPPISTFDMKDSDSFITEP